MERAGPGRISDAILAVVRRFRIGLVVNMAQEREDLDLGRAVESVGTRVFALPLVDLGTIEREDAIGAAHRRRIPLLVHMPFSKAGHDVESLVRRLLGTPDVDRIHPRIEPRAPGVEENLYETLEVDRGAGEHEIRRAAKRIHDVFGGLTPATVMMGEGRGTQAFVERAQRAQKLLLDRRQKRDYDRRLVQAEDASRPQLAAKPVYARPASTLSQASPAPSQPSHAVPVPPQGATGAWLAGVRKERGLTLEEMSAITKVSVTYLSALEAEDYAALPEPVYVRGFLVTCARTIGLDADAVARSYLELMRASRPRGG